MKKTYFLILIIGLAPIISCKKHKGCTDIFATNYNEYIEPENSNNSCYYSAWNFIYFSNNFIFEMVNNGVNKIELHHENIKYSVYENSQTIDTNDLNKNFYSIGITREIDHKYDTTKYELISYYSSGAKSTINGNLLWIGGLLESQRFQ